MANPENLRPVRTPEEAKERGRNGGIKSGKVRRAKKKRREIVSQVLDAPLSEDFRKQLEGLIGKVDDEDATIFTMMVGGLVRTAMRGNVQSFNVLYELAESGEFAFGDLEDDPLSKSLRELGESL